MTFPFQSHTRGDKVIHLHSNSNLLRRARMASSACVLALGIASCGGGGHDAVITDPNAILVEMPGTAFSPFNTIVKVNGTVSFDFPGTEHDVTFTAKAG